MTRTPVTQHESPRPTGRYAGKVAVVTGAGSGIGRAITEGLLTEGATVVANDVAPDALAALGEWATRVGSAERLTGVVADVAVPETAATLVEAATAAGHGRLDALFNHAGVGSATPALEIGEEEWSRVMAINVDAVRRLAVAAGRVMVDQGGGAILNTASVAGTHGLPGRLGYVASKHAVVGITRALAVEWGPLGVRVNAICPGLTETGMSQKLKRTNPEYWAAREAVVPLRRSGLPEEQAAMALFLNSDDAAYVSGLVAEVDGGAHALYSGYTVTRPQT
ncbi:SDR family oxidoreductase [Nocardioides jishulii]|uniref:SDR family oxidoreductase n=1 Tax=Nocardioides jishulii TaxID=2575440 RepID=A0A4U2YQG8_9ACTN|nr:SDR family oxidoreductase [Nocardioides jishulii]TKI63666.1 SDR family oxidoreductase [Nocardioides jishulii]